MPPVPSPLREAALDALAVLLPVDCAGCGAPDRAVCALCAVALAPVPFPVHRGARDASAVSDIWAALRYEDVARRVLLAVKDSGRTDAARPLARALRAAIAAALGAASATVIVPGPVELAAIPSTRAAFRRRGYAPVRELLRRAGLRDSGVLRAVRQTADQAGLGLAARADNRAGSLRARPAVRGRAFLIVDDIVTTGATLDEARRALEAAGALVIGAAAVAHTPRRRAADDAARNF